MRTAVVLAWNPVLTTAVDVNRQKPGKMTGKSQFPEAEPRSRRFTRALAAKTSEIEALPCLESEGVSNVDAKLRLR